MKQSEITHGIVQKEHSVRRPAHMGQPVGWSGRIYGADEEIKGYEHATQTPLSGEEGEKDYHEWHYAHLTTEDDDVIIVGFITKQLFRAALGPAPISPRIAVDIVMKDGTKIDTLKPYEHYRASHEKLDVEIGDSWMKTEDDHADRIHVHVNSGDVELDVDIDRTVPAFRSQTGKTIYGDGTKWEAWDIVQPAAIMEGELTIKGKSRHIKGKAYVDHAYGNEMFGVHHWYWASVDIGSYAFLTAASYTADNHMAGNERDLLIAFMIAKDRKIIGRGPKNVQFVAGPKEYIPEMHRHIAKELQYRYTDGTRWYVLRLKQKDVLRIKPLLASVIKNRLLGALAKKFAIGGPYLRATYDAWLEVWENEQLIENYGPDDCSGQVVGEIFYPGKDDPAVNTRPE